MKYKQIILLICICTCILFSFSCVFANEVMNETINQNDLDVEVLQVSKTG